MTRSTDIRPVLDRQRASFFDRLYKPVMQAGAPGPRREWGLLPPDAPQLEDLMRAAVTP